MLHFLHFFVALLLFFTSSEAAYILRYSTINNGGILFTGNTLGLSKATGQNQPGTRDSIGAFITTDLTQQVGDYPPGTTLIWQNNSSDAFLALPEGSSVLYAELIWSGSYGFQNQITGNQPNTPVSITIPEGTKYSVAPDPATSQIAITPGYTNAGTYTRSANVTSIVQAGGAGFYTVGGVAATISALDESHNAAGWTLGVVFQNGKMPTSNLSLFVGCEQASSASSPPATVAGFCTPSSGPLTGNLLISAIEGDANIRGDTMLFGNSLPLTAAANALSGDNNPVNNFFGSQINTLVTFDGSEFVGSGQLDTRGSFGSYNSNPFTGQVLPGSRQGYDITSVDISNKLVYNQTVAYAKGTTTGDDYMINALGMQIQIGAPTLEMTKQVDGTDSIFSLVGDTATFSFTITNTGTGDATGAVLVDALDSSLSYVPGTLVVNGIPTGGNPDVGIPLNTIAIGQTITVSFQASINAYPHSGNVIFNNGFINYDFQPCQGSAIGLLSNSDQVQIQLPIISQPLLTATKFVNSQFEVISSVGNNVIFTVNITNTGDSDALDVIFQDLLEPGLEFVADSFTINGELVSPSPNLITGVPIGTIPIGETVIVEFQALITAYPVNSSLYHNSATINYSYLEADDTLVPADPVATNVVTINLYVPPVGFQGKIRSCHYINGKRYCVYTSWIGAFSTNVLGYRIYEQGTLLGTVGPSVHSLKLCNFKSRSQISLVEIRALYANQIESAPLFIRIVP